MIDWLRAPRAGDRADDDRLHRHRAAGARRPARRPPRDDQQDVLPGGRRAGPARRMGDARRAGSKTASTSPRPGVSAGIDMALAVIAKLAGPGGQRQPRRSRPSTTGTATRAGIRSRRCTDWSDRWIHSNSGCIQWWRRAPSPPAREAAVICQKAAAARRAGEGAALDRPSQHVVAAPRSFHYSARTVRSGVIT